MNSRLFEIWSEIDSHLQQIHDLRVEEQTIIHALIPIWECSDIPLEFDDNAQTIRWYGGLIRLSKKPYLLLKTLWTGKNHRATITRVERRVWNAGTRKRPFIERHTLCTLINRVQKTLKENRLPYKIKTLKTKKIPTQEIKGYQLVCARRTKKY
jgi:DNA-binding response OmpR family regulator